MGKLIDIDLVKAEIGKLVSPEHAVVLDALVERLEAVTSPASEDAKKEIEKAVRQAATDYYPHSDDDFLTEEEFKTCISKVAECAYSLGLQGAREEARKKLLALAVEARVQFGVGIPVVKITRDGWKPGDIVKVLVL